MEEEVFVDAEEEITPRRSGWKRRSTAGNSPVTNLTKRSRQAKKMPLERSPGKEGREARQKDDKKGNARSPKPPEAGSDEFWEKMGVCWEGWSPG